MRATGPAEEPEVIDLGLVEPADPASWIDTERDRSITETGDGVAVDAPGVPLLLRVQQQLRSRRSTLVVTAAALGGLLVGALGYGTYDAQLDAATARNEPSLLAQVVTVTARSEGTFTVLISMTNVAEHAVTVHALDLDEAANRYTREDLDRELPPGQPATFLVGGLLDCDEPMPPLGSLRAELTTVDGTRTSARVPLAVSPQHRSDLSGQRSWACIARSRPPSVYATHATNVADEDDHVRISLSLRTEGDRRAVLTALTPRTDAFAVTVEGLPLQLGEGIDSAVVETTWRVEDCTSAANATAIDAALVATIDGADSQEYVQVWDDAFAELVRLGTRVCVTS